jgi:hypothetical protein
MQIGFYGDSFCKDKFYPKYETYVSLLLKHYDAGLAHVGQPGSSLWDLIINQFPKEETKLPDICVFCWTSHERFYHKTVRTIRQLEALNYSATKIKVTPNYSFGLNSDVWKASEQYYKHLFDDNKARLEYKAALHYFDTVILESYKNTKFIHLWSFGDTIKIHDEAIDTWAPDNLRYMHDWKNGVEIRPSLMSIATRQQLDYNAPNHLPGKDNNYFLFEQIKNAIGAY